MAGMGPFGGQWNLSAPTSERKKQDRGQMFQDKNCLKVAKRIFAIKVIIQRNLCNL